MMPGQRCDEAFAGLLRRISSDAQKSVAGLPGASFERVGAYLTFCANASDELRHKVRPSDIARLLNTPRYRDILGLSPGSSAALELVDLEVRECVVRLETAAEQVGAEWRKWEDAGDLVVPDTNVFLHALDKSICETDWRALAQIGPQMDVTVVLLLPVIDELDKAKRGNQRAQARKMLREIDDLLGDSSSAQLPMGNSGRGLRLEVLIDDVEHEPLPRVDQEIIDRTLTLVSRTPMRVYLLTGDTGMAFRARHAGLRCIKLPTPNR